MKPGRKKGFKMSEEHKQKISRAHLGKKHSAAHRLKNSEAKLGKKFSTEHRLKMSQAKKGKHPKNSINWIGENHPEWKGENATKEVIHQWVTRWKGKAKICIDCGVSSKERVIHWSNIDHKYRRVLSDYQSRCVPCHDKYDKKCNSKYVK